MSEETILPEVITKPKNRKLVSSLKRKLIEYKERVVEFQDYDHPELAFRLNNSYRNSLFKYKILERLLTEGKVVAKDLEWEISKEHGSSCIETEFKNAYGVIGFYCGQVGGAVFGGTGLK